MTRRLALLALSAALLTGCGFHLRNALNLPENLGPVRVLASDPYSPLGELLPTGSSTQARRRPRPTRAATSRPCR
jgi:LPS-assembly lipoprotein